MEFLHQLGLLAMGSRMRALSERLYGLADAVYSSRGLAVQGRWFPMLRLLHDRGPKTVGEIAESIGQTHPAVSQLADKLVREGWLEHVADSHDRRRRRLGLTAQSSQALRAAKPVWRAIEEVLGEACNDAGIDLLAALSGLDRVLDRPLVESIVQRCTDIDRASVRVVAFEPALREYFYRLNADWLRKYFYIEEIDHSVLSNPEREILEPGGAIFFALLGDKVVGTCALKRERNGSFELTKMAVDERHQGLGIGRRLIEAAITEFQQRQGTQLFLETNSKLEPAVRLYESVGFEHQPTTKPDSHYDRSNIYMIWRERDRA